MVRNIKHWTLEAPRYCAAMLKEKASLVKGLKELYLKKNYSTILMAASGSSFNIASSVRWILQDWMDVKVELVTPMTFSMLYHKKEEDTLVLCMSQSGKSTNTIKSVQTARKLGYDAAVLCADPDGPIRTYCEHVFSYGAGIDDYYVAKGFPTSVLFLILFALETGLAKKTIDKEFYDETFRQLELLIRELPGYHEKVLKFYDACKEDFINMKRVMITGIGGTYGNAREGALKLTETIGVPANGYETEEFLHGPYYEVNKDYAVFIFDTEPKMHTRNVSIFQEIRRLTDKVFLLTAFDDVAAERVLPFGIDVDPRLLVLAGPVLFQIISSNVCEELDILCINMEHYRVTRNLSTKVEKSV